MNIHPKSAFNKLINFAVDKDLLQWVKVIQKNLLYDIVRLKIEDRKEFEVGFKHFIGKLFTFG